MSNDIKKQITLYYIYCALIGTWFTSGITLFFSRKFLTDTNFGLIDAIAFGIGLLAEIPSGAIADRFGRRQTVIMGTLCMGIGIGIWGLAVAGWMVFVGILLFSIGASLQSGADEAMMYDYLKTHGKETLWTRISANRAIIARTSYIIAIFIGGLAYVYYDRLPFLLRALTFFVMVIPLVQLAVIDKFQDIQTEATQITHYWHDLKSGIKEFFQPKARWLIPLFLIVQGMSYTVFTAGILRPLLYEKSGLAIAYHSFAIAVALVMTVLSMLLIRRYEAKYIKPSVIYCFAASCAIGFAVNIGNISIVLSLIGLTLLQVASYSLMPLLSTALNSTITSRYRATTISTASFMQHIVYVVAAPVIGFLSYKGFINEVAIGVTLMVVMGILLSLGLKYLSDSHLVN